MNSGLLTFPKSDQLLRGGDLLKLNKHLNGFPLPSAHPKIVNGLHAFPKQDVEYGAYYPLYSYKSPISATGGPIDVLNYSFTAEIRFKRFTSNRDGAHGLVCPGFTIDTNVADGWGFCNDPSNNLFFKIQSVSQGLNYKIYLNSAAGFHTHTIVRDNTSSSLTYYYDGLLQTILNINPLLNITHPAGFGHSAGFNCGSSGFYCVISFFRMSFIVRNHSWIFNNYNNRFALDAQTIGLYNCYNENGSGAIIQNVADKKYNSNSTHLWVSLL